MMVLEEFSTPGFVADMRPDGRQAWSSHVSRVFSKVLGPQNPQFFSPINFDDLTDATPAAITWNAFPRRLATKADRFKKAEARAAQEEYCEWSAELDSHQKIVRVFFTTETREYFEKVWRTPLTKNYTRCTRNA